MVLERKVYGIGMLGKDQVAVFESSGCGVQPFFEKRMDRLIF